MESNGGHGYAVSGGVRAVEEVVDSLPVGAHVGAVGVEEQGAGFRCVWERSLWRNSNSPFWPWGAAEGPVEIDAVGDYGHGEDAVADAPQMRSSYSAMPPTV